MYLGKETSGNGLNKYACACVMAATIISAIFGYSEFTFYLYTASYNYVVFVILIHNFLTCMWNFEFQP